MKSQKSTGQLPPFDGKTAANLAGARSCARMRLERTRRFGFASGAGVGNSSTWALAQNGKEDQTINLRFKS